MPHVGHACPGRTTNRMGPRDHPLVCTMRGLLVVASAALPQLRSIRRASPALLQRVIVDLHDDTTRMIHDFGQVDIPRMRAGHITGIFFSIRTDPGPRCDIVCQ
jgi:hypothetical protein